MDSCSLHCWTIVTSAWLTAIGDQKGIQRRGSKLLFEATCDELSRPCFKNSRTWCRIYPSVWLIAIMTLCLTRLLFVVGRLIFPLSFVWNTSVIAQYRTHAQLNVIQNIDISRRYVLFTSFQSQPMLLSQCLSLSKFRIVDWLRTVRFSLARE